MKTLLIIAFSFLTFITAQSQRSFIHYSADPNLDGNTTQIDNALINANPLEKIQITKNWNPNGTSYADYNNHETGLWYNGLSQWTVYNDDLNSMVGNLAFNIFIPGETADSYVHLSDAATIISNWTVLDHPALNGNPNALLFVTQNLSAFAVYDESPLGVWYNGSRWSVFNQDLSAMPENIAFNVYVPRESDDAFIHTATSENTYDNYTLIDHPSTNGNPNAILIVTQNWNPVSSSGVYNNHTIGVWYSEYFEKWSIFNQDISGIPVGSAYNVLVADEGNSESLPDQWQTTDVGAVDVTGMANYQEGSFIISGSGTDIWETTDAFRFVYQELAENENVELIAKVASISNTSAWAKSGVMIRQSLDENSKNAMTLATTDNGTYFHRRMAAGAISEITTGPLIWAPVWVRIVKEGNLITSSVSANGIVWEDIDEVNFELSGNYYAGIAVTSHNNIALTTSILEDVQINITQIEEPPSGINIRNSEPLSDLLVSPNPLSEMGNVKFSLNSDENINLAIYSTEGKLLMTLAEGKYSRGNYSLPIDLKEFDAGLYLIILKTESYIRSERLIHITN